MRNEWEQGYCDSQYRDDMIEQVCEAIERYGELEGIIDETVPSGEEKQRIKDALHEVYRLLLSIKREL